MIHSMSGTISTAVAFLVIFVGGVSAKPALDRTVLPVLDPVYEPISELDARNAKAPPFLFSADETADVGVDEATPVTEDYKERHNEFTGTITTVTVELKK